jgi:predicted amidophosphoribosyltransferase
MELLTTILDWCFPPRPEELLIRNLQTPAITPQPRTQADDTISLLPFHHPINRALIHEAKFFYNRHAHELLGSIAQPFITTQYPDSIIIPIPLHPQRERSRGFNQVTSCLRTQTSLRSHINTSILYRHRPTKPQTQLSAAARLDNVAQAFRVTTRVLPPHPLLLIDDVYTTGATMNAARSTLRAAFPNHKIYCLTFAYT